MAALQDSEAERQRLETALQLAQAGQQGDAEQQAQLARLMDTNAAQRAQLQQQEEALAALQR